jgi:hypothetical protein
MGAFDSALTRVFVPKNEILDSHTLFSGGDVINYPVMK